MIAFIRIIKKEIFSNFRIKWTTIVNKKINKRIMINKVIIVKWIVFWKNYMKVGN